MLLSLDSCLGIKYLEKDQKLLVHQRIKVKEKFDKEGMKNLLVQKTNRRFFGLPISALTWMYEVGKRKFNKETSWFIHSKKDFIRKQEKKEKKFDIKIALAKKKKTISNLTFRKQQKIFELQSKIDNGNMLMQWGEQIAVYNPQYAQASAEALNNYIFNHGYFNSHIITKISEFNKRVKVRYIIDPGVPFHYDTIMYAISDSTIQKLVFESKNNSLLKIGDQYNQKTINNERERISLVLRNNGYFNFRTQYIDFQVDTTYGFHNEIALQIRILEPSEKKYNQVFKISAINFITNPDDRDVHPTYLNQIGFFDSNNQYNKKVLSQRIFFRPDSLYSASASQLTQKHLYNLENFKFVNIHYDTTSGKFIANILTRPLDRYSMTHEAGVTVTQGFPGPYYSLNFRKNNPFHGLETLEINGRFGFEGVASFSSSANFYRSTEAIINASISFPRLLIPLGKKAQKLGRYNPRTKINLGYSYTNRPEYRRFNLSFSNIFSWEGNHGAQYSFTSTNLQIIQSDLNPAFNELLLNIQKNQGNNLINSFRPSLVSSMIFSLTWNPLNYGLENRNSYFFRLQAESGGTTFNLFEPTIATKYGLNTYKYVRLSFDIRKKQIIDFNTSLALRFNMGIVYSYGANKALPYEKYFFVGGSNSVRAWRPRRLGLGSLPPIISANIQKDGLFNYQYEKPGTILLEGSVELRKKLFGFVNGAVFFDVGNVWSFDNSTTSSPDDPNVASWAKDGSAQFKFNQFYNQIAVGTGFGLRFDFSFLVLRLDVGIKAWDPARKEGDRLVLSKLKFIGPYSSDREPVIYNVGIGYPF